MSAITFRVFAAIAGALLGLGAFVLACQALTIALIDRLGTVGGLTAAAATLLAFAVIAFWFVSRSAIRKHPVALVLAALLLGYTLIRDPGKAMRQMQSIVLGLL